MTRYNGRSETDEDIFELIRNAKKFTTRGCIIVGAIVSDDGNWIECFVEDTGLGMSKESLGRVFDRFFKVNEFVQGTGLGLPICKAIVELLGGDIRLTSELNKGTTVYFRIPYRKPE
ncbi:sensor histidine kinase [Butyricimonas synergistica]|uniref:sensor histidine kinase n=1 Tax=Butyricimonas synergistica TaxID=544644 RepID=UPI0009DB342F|nr:HAMP domain-containing sensor histidine kinase [Butyricimonas synergistica]